MLTLPNVKEQSWNLHCPSPASSTEKPALQTRAGRAGKEKAFQPEGFSDL